MTVVARVRGHGEAIGSDLSFGLPTSGAALQDARKNSIAMPMQDGDVVITRVRSGY
jgi:hypothetical protein